MPLILIVDDDPSTLNLLESVFEKDGYQVITAGGGRAAIALARQHQPQLILLDFMMPGLNGAAICKIIREDPQIGPTPIIMLTAAHSLDHKLNSLESGADEYLTKPVHPAELRARVRLLLSRSAPAPRPEPPRKDSHVVAVLGTSGGAGTSTVALNLAASMVDECSDTVLAELTPDFTGITTQLGLSPGQINLHWSNLSTSSLVDAHLQKFLLAHPSGLKILPGGPEELQPEQVRQIIRQLASMFRYVFLDLGRGFNPRVQAAQPLISQYVVVVRAESRSLQPSIQQIQLLAEKGVPWERISIALVASTPYPYFLDQEQTKQILKASGIRNNVLLYLPPLHNLICSADQQHLPLVLLDPDAISYKQYFKAAAKRLLAEAKPVAA